MKQIIIAFFAVIVTSSSVFAAQAISTDQVNAVNTRFYNQNEINVNKITVQYTMNADQLNSKVLECTASVTVEVSIGVATVSSTFEVKGECDQLGSAVKAAVKTFLTQLL